MKISFSPAQRRWPLAAAAGTVIILAGCTTASITSSGSTGTAAPAPTGSPTQPGSGTYNLPAGVQTLKVNNAAGTIRVTAATGSSQIHVVQKASGGAVGSHQVSGSSATIAARCPGGVRVGVHGCNMGYQIAMPASVPLNVEGGAGQVTLQGGPDNVHVATGAGEVQGTGLGRGAYNVTTGIGQVGLTFTAAPTQVKVSTDTGAINVTVPKNAAYQVRTSSELGEKNIKVPNQAAAANVIDLHVKLGEISLQHS